MVEGIGQKYLINLIEQGKSAMAALMNKINDDLNRFVDALDKTTASKKTDQIQKDLKALLTKAMNLPKADVEGRKKILAQIRDILNMPEVAQSLPKEMEPALKGILKDLARIDKKKVGPGGAPNDAPEIASLFDPFNPVGSVDPLAPKKPDENSGGINVVS